MIAAVFIALAVLLMGVAAYSVAKGPKAASSDAVIDAQGPRGKGKRGTLFVGGAILVVLMVGAAGTVGFLQLSGRHPASETSAATSTEGFAKQLHDAPTAGGYKKLANMYFAAAQYDKAVWADHRAIALGADDSSTWSEFGESMVMASDGQVPPQALAAFTNAISLDPHDARARFYIGMAEAQIGNLRQAVAIWRDLERGAGPNAKWLPLVRQHIAAFSKQGNFDPTSVAPAAPSVTALRLAIASMREALNQNADASSPTQAPDASARKER